MHPCIVGHVTQQFGDQPVRRLEHSETQLTYTSRSSEQRELTTGLDVGAAYVRNIWLGFLFEIGGLCKKYMAGFSFEIGGGHTPLPLSCCTTLLVEGREPCGRRGSGSGSTTRGQREAWLVAIFIK
jgi:hypothetical protein